MFLATIFFWTYPGWKEGSKKTCGTALEGRKVLFGNAMDGRKVVQQKKHYIWNSPGWKKVNQRNSFWNYPLWRKKMFGGEVPWKEEGCYFFIGVKSHGRKEGCYFLGGEVLWKEGRLLFLSLG